MALMRDMNSLQRRPGPQRLSALDLALLSGGDPRIAVDLDTLLNGYGARPFPHDGEISLSSSTANTISRRGYAAAAAACERFGPADQRGAAHEEIRRALHAQLDLDDTDIVLAPSGTDGALQALAIARWSLGRPVTSIVVGAEESGSGIRPAVSGRHFAAVTSAGMAVTRDTPLAGLEAEFVAVALRDRDGHERPMSQIDADVHAAAVAAIGAGRSVALFLMDHSKLGARGPGGACIDALHAEFPGCVQLVVDACQGRLSRSRIGFYLERGALVLITGSKFFGGPPLSGAVLVPAWVAARLETGVRVPPALAAYTARSDWPRHWTGICAQLPERGNPGQALRWFAALAEMQAYHAVPKLFRRLALAEFGAAFARAVARYPELRPLPAPAWVGVEADEEFSARTVFPFVVMHDGRPLSLAQAKLLYHALNIDVADITGAPIGAAICHIGQPVSLADGSAALRVSADARLVSDNWTGSHDGEAGRRLAARLDGIAVTFEKIRVLLPVLHRVASM